MTQLEGTELGITSTRVLTLLFVVGEDETTGKRRALLGLKKRGFGKDYWNGFGGKLEPGETIRQAAKRELQEESGLEARLEDIHRVGTIMFVFEGDPLGLEVHVFHVNKYTGVEAETEEMRPQWYTFDQFPFKSMWPDDELWISHLVKFDEAHHTGKPLEGFTATFLFGADQKTIINYQIDTYPVKLSKDAKSSVFADGLPEGFDVANQKWQTAP